MPYCRFDVPKQHICLDIPLQAMALCGHKVPHRSFHCSISSGSSLPTLTVTATGRATKQNKTVSIFLEFNVLLKKEFALMIGQCMLERTRTCLQSIKLNSAKHFVAPLLLLE